MSGNDAEKLMQRLVKAAEEEDTDALRKLAATAADRVTNMEAMEANQFVWGVFEELRDTVDHKWFWLPLAKAADGKSEDLEDDMLRSLILDTAAHCYALADEIPTAQELQVEAVDASAEANGGEADHNIASYYEELKGLIEDAREKRDRAR